MSIENREMNNLRHLQHPSSYCTWSVGHSHLYVLGLHTRLESHDAVSVSHGSHLFDPTEKIFEHFRYNLKSILNQYVQKLFLEAKDMHQVL